MTFQPHFLVPLRIPDTRRLDGESLIARKHGSRIRSPAFQRPLPTVALSCQADDFLLQCFLHSRQPDGSQLLNQQQAAVQPVFASCRLSASRHSVFRIAS